MKEEMSPGAHRDDDLVVLSSPLEAIRARPAMYIGEISPKAIWKLVEFVLDCSVGTDDPVPSGAKHVVIALFSDGTVDIQDDGQGLLFEACSLRGREDEPWAIAALNNLWVGLRHPIVALPVINALSSMVIVSAHHGGRGFTAWFDDGKQDGPINEWTTDDIDSHHGTSITFWPRAEIFGGQLDRAYFDEQLASYADTHPDVEFSVIDYDIGAFDAAVADAKQVVVRMMSDMLVGAPDSVPLRLTDPADLAEFRRLLAVEYVLDGYCMCVGKLAFEFLDESGQRLTRATIHHGTHLRWDGWSGDGWLADGKALLAWLSTRGVPIDILPAA